MDKVPASILKRIRNMFRPLYSCRTCCFGGFLAGDRDCVNSSVAVRYLIPGSTDEALIMR